MRLALAALVLAVANAHAEPPRLSHDVKPLRLRIDRAPRHDSGIDEALAIALTRVTHVAGKLSRHGLIPYLQVDNLVSASRESAPRTIVIGIQLQPILRTR